MVISTSRKNHIEKFVFLSVVLSDKYLIAGLHLNCFGKVKGAISAAGWGKKLTSVTNIMLNGRGIACHAVKCVFYCQPGLSNLAVASCCLLSVT